MADVADNRHAPLPIPARAGIGLRSPHLPEFMTGRPEIAWLEVHTENYLGAGGPRRHALEAIRSHYPLSLHGVGLSLGSVERPDTAHLASIKKLANHLEPGLMSEHIAWSTSDGTFYNDLLPLPYTEEALSVLCTNVDIVQSILGRRILLENPASYLRFEHSPIPEWEFIAELAHRTGCGLLVDVNNLYVSAVNIGLDVSEYLASIPAEAVGEIHVAGHDQQEIAGRPLLIDDHGHPVIDKVWSLLGRVLERIGPCPVLIERDTHVPPLAELLAEAETASRILASPGVSVAHAG